MVFPAACFCFFRLFWFFSVPFPSSGFPLHLFLVLVILSADSTCRGFAGASLRERTGAWERSRSGRHAHWGRRTAHAEKWWAWRLKSRGSPCGPRLCVTLTGTAGQGRVRRRPGPPRAPPSRPRARFLAPGTSALGAAGDPTGRRRESAGGARARGGRLGSMSQQRPARKLPSLLVDPAEETVRRRCRDPINVEGLLVSPGDGRVPSAGGPGGAPRGRGRGGAGLRPSRRLSSVGEPDGVVCIVSSRRAGPWLPLCVLRSCTARVVL